MSIAYDSPPPSQVDSYFSPHIATYSTQSPNSKDSSPSSGQTPFFTAPISPTVNQEFFAAIQNRSTFSNFANAPLGRSNSTTDGTRSLPPSSAIPLNFSSSIANRRKGSMTGTMASISAGASSAVVAKLTTYTPEDIIRLLSDPQQSNPEPLTPSNDPLRARHHKFTLSLLLIDVRNLVQYGESHIHGSINVCIPNMILKRTTFSMDKMINTLIIEEDRGKLGKWEEYANIVLYDASGDSLGDNSTVGFVAQKFMTEGYAGCLGWLRGGFDSFAARHAALLTSHHRSSANHNHNHNHLHHHPIPAPTAEASTSVPATGASPVHNGGASHSRRAQLAFGPFTAPVTPYFDNQGFNPFFSNIRQNMELSKDGITERFPIRLPLGVVPVGVNDVRGARVPRALFPRWLLDVVGPNGEGERKLAMMYENIEKAEQHRLQNIMFHSSRSSSNAADHPLSICAGLEKGALNRYTNTWPYEYTRVKINDCTDDQTDYINASYVQYHPEESPAPTTRSRKYRRYIATQGPLPTTFSDFWKMVWQQRSCVLVMLTKEEEMNRIKCHCYWPSDDESVKTFDSLTVTLLRETTCSTIDGDIVTRVFSIRHLGSPSSPPLEVTQIQYTGWMDFGVPENPVGVLKVVDVADKAQKAYEAAMGAKNIEVGPMVVHCSAGCGRSGSFCAVDTVLGFFEEGEDAMGDRDLVSEVVARFREQRVSMVQTLRQFVFCHEAIWWSLLGFADDGGGGVCAGADDMKVDS